MLDTIIFQIRVQSICYINAFPLKNQKKVHNYKSKIRDGVGLSETAGSTESNHLTNMYMVYICFMTSLCTFKRFIIHIIWASNDY